MNTQKTTSQNTERKRKLIITGVIVLALILVAIFSTLAYLTSTTNTLDNVMTAGKIEAFLDEAKTKDDGYGVKESPETRIPADPTTTKTTGNNYTLVPGHEYSKDPQMHVKEKSEPCYAYIIIDDKMLGTGLEVYKSGTQSPEAQMVTNGWTKLDGVKLPTGMTGNVYYYKDIVKAKEAQQDLKTFANFTLNPKLTNEQIATLGQDANKHIIVNGAAIQSDGFGSAKAAWEAVYGGGEKKDPKLTTTVPTEGVKLKTGDTSSAYSLTSDSTGTLSYSSTDSDIAKLSETAANGTSKTFYVKAGTKAGTAKITISQAAAGDYKAASTSFNVTVTGTKGVKVSGKIYNADTVLTRNEQPLSGATVQLYYGEGTDPKQTQLSNENGEYSFSNVPANAAIKVVVVAPSAEGTGSYLNDSQSTATTTEEDMTLADIKMSYKDSYEASFNKGDLSEYTIDGTTYYDGTCSISGAVSYKNYSISTSEWGENTGTVTIVYKNPNGVGDNVEINITGVFNEGDNPRFVDNDGNELNNEGEVSISGNYNITPTVDQKADPALFSGQIYWEDEEGNRFFPSNAPEITGKVICEDPSGQWEAGKEIENFSYVPDTGEYSFEVAPRDGEEKILIVDVSYYDEVTGTTYSGNLQTDDFYSGVYPNTDIKLEQS